MGPLEVEAIERCDCRDCRDCLERTLVMDMSELDPAGDRCGVDLADHICRPMGDDATEDAREDPREEARDEAREEVMRDRCCPIAAISLGQNGPPRGVPTLRSGEEATEPFRDELRE